MAGRPSSDIRRARLSVSAGFFVFAAVLGNWATRIPAIKADLGLSDGELGTALLGMALGTLAGGRLRGRPAAPHGGQPPTPAPAPRPRARFDRPGGLAPLDGGRAPARPRRLQLPRRRRLGGGLERRLPPREPRVPAGLRRP